MLSVYSGMARSFSCPGGRKRRRSVLALLRLPLRDRDLGVVDVRPVAVGRHDDVPEPVVVVALGEVGAVVGAAVLLALERGDERRLARVEHEAELEDAERV